MKLSDVKIGERKIAIEVSATTGKFTAEFDEQDYSADTRADLVEQLKKVVKRADRSRPIGVTMLGMVVKTARKSWAMEGAGTVDAMLRGRHDRNRAWLLTSVDGKHKFQVSGYSSDATIARRLTLAEALEYREKFEAVRAATTALEDFVGAVKVDPAELLRKAVADGE